MIYVGIDSVEIERFKDWHTIDKKQLAKIFSDQEIDYCLSSMNLAAQRFAARFTAREALYKALHSGMVSQRVPFFTLCRHTSIKKTDLGAPYFIIDWQALGLDSHPTNSIALSWTHTKTTATAIVILTFQS